MSSTPARNKRWPLINTPMFIVGLTATVGISSIAFAAQHRTTPAPDQPIKTSTAAATMTSDPHITPVPGDSIPVNEPAPTSEAESSTTVTINEEVIPLQNGTVQRTYVDANGNTYNVDVSVSSHTTDTGNASADVTVLSHSSSTEQHPARGSPQQ